MASAASRSSGNTDLYIGTMRVEIGLFGTQAKPGKEASFDTAGPNGGVLRYEQRGVPKPLDEATETAPDAPVLDALTGEDPGSDVPFPEDGNARAAMAAMDAGTVEGEFRQVLVEEGSAEVVEPDAVRRGVRLEDGRWVDCTDQLAAIVARTKLDRMEIVRCIDSTQVRRERVIGAYYIGAQDPKGAPVLRLLYEALRARREVAVVKYTTRSRQQLGVIVPHAKTGTLVLLSLVFAEDFREAPSKATLIQKAGVRADHVEVMGQLLEAMHGTIDVFDELRDEAISLREELRARALAGEMDAAVVEPVEVVEETPDLEEALGASLAAVRAGKL